MTIRASGVGYRLAQVGAGGVALGGLFDLFVSRLLPHHEAFLGIGPGEAPPATAALLLLLLRTLGIALVAVGVGALALLAAWRRAGLRWAGVAAAGMVLFAEGANAWAIRRVGSPLYLGPLVCALLVGAGVSIAATGRRYRVGTPHSERETT
ncbi:MAG TPA: hypothetical protein VK922_00770 [Gemmatimonadaceae bacterium]|nr:hypothetical protein [Gemmatimonadaceae bacterium]